MELPYDYSLSHHQLLFNFVIVTCWHKYVNSFYKNKQNSTFIELLIYWIIDLATKLVEDQSKL